MPIFTTNVNLIFKMGLIVAVALATECALATSYYISALGNDGNSGTSTNAPWLTITKVNGKSFTAGDVVSFRGGDTFGGTLTPGTGGISGNPIVFTSYGTGRAVINGGNAGGCVVGSSYVSVTNLNFVGSGRTNGNTAQGIFISTSYVLVDHVEVHGFEHCGVEAFNNNNLTLKYIYAHDNGQAGIYVDGVKYQTGLYIGYCRCDNNPGDPTITNDDSGDGIIIGNQMGALVEYCEASTNGWDMPWNGNGPAGIWGYACYQTTFQYCIAHDNKTPSGEDGDGFDLDGGTGSSTYQYCLAYNNDGAGFLGWQYSGQSPWTNNTYRYCISVNDGAKTLNSALAFGTSGGTYSNARVYNNTFYNTRSGATDLEILDSCPGSLFANNIFVANSSVFNTSGSSMSYEGNCYWQLNGGFSLDGYSSFSAWAAGKGQETVGNVLVGINANPQLVDPTVLMTLTDPTQLAMLSAFQLNTNSPCIDAGLNLQSLYGINPGSNDFWGTPIPPGGPFDMGAYEFTNGVASTNPPWAPTIYNATAIYGQVSLTWSAVYNATNYEVKRSTTSGAETNLASTSSTSYTDTGVVNGTTYYYVVAAVNAYGTSGNSGEVTASPPVPPPAGTVLVHFTDVNGTNDFVTPNPDSNGNYWNNATVSDYPSDTINGSAAPLALVNTADSPSGWTLWVTDLPGGDNYGFNCTADSGYNHYNGPYPSAVGIFPQMALDSSMSVGGGSGGSVTISGLNPGKAYNVLVYGATSVSTANGGSGGYQTDTLTVGTSASPSAVDFNSVDNASTVVTWTNVTPSAGGQIVFNVVPDASNPLPGGDVNFLQVSPASTNTSISTNPPAAPTILNVSTNSGQVSLTWSAVATATNYNVKRSTTSGAETNLASTTSTNYTDTSVVNGTTYYYVLTAVNAYGTSGNSAQVTATPTTSSSPPQVSAAALVDFNSGDTTDVTPSPDTHGLYWNNIVAAQTGSGAVQLNGSSAPIALVNTTNANAGWTLAVTNLSGWNANAAASWQDYGGAYPAAVTNFPSTALRDGMAISGSGISVTLSGLATNCAYNLLTYGADGSSYGPQGPQTNKLTVGSSLSLPAASFIPYNNGTTVVAWTNVAPSARGQIVFTIAGSGMLNLLEVSQVASSAQPPARAYLTNSISGKTLNLSWPAGQGWRLLSETNSISIGLSLTGWQPVGGTADGNYSTVINPSNPAVFYRLVYP